MLDYRSILHGPHYVTWGVPATLVLSNGTVYDQLTAIDMTTGVGLAGPSELETQTPTALMLVGDLADAGIEVDSIDNATLTINSVDWRITGYKELWSPNGTLDGEVQLFLEVSPTEVVGVTIWDNGGTIWDDGQTIWPLP